MYLIFSYYVTLVTEPYNVNYAKILSLKNKNTSFKLFFLPTKSKNNILNCFDSTNAHIGSVGILYLHAPLILLNLLLY